MPQPPPAPTGRRIPRTATERPPQVRKGKRCTSDTGGPLRRPSTRIRARPRASRQRSEIPQPHRPQPPASQQGMTRTPAPRGPWQPPTPPTDELPTEQCKGLSVAPVRVLATTRRKTTHADQQVPSAQHLHVLQPSNHGPAVAVVTTVREDDHQPRAYLVHEGRQSAILLEIPFGR